MARRRSNRSSRGRRTTPSTGQPRHKPSTTSGASASPPEPPKSAVDTGENPIVTEGTAPEPTGTGGTATATQTAPNPKDAEAPPPDAPAEAPQPSSKRPSPAKNRAHNRRSGTKGHHTSSGNGSGETVIEPPEAPAPEAPASDTPPERPAPEAPGNGSGETVIEVPDPKSTEPAEETVNGRARADDVDPPVSDDPPVAPEASSTRPTRARSRGRNRRSKGRHTSSGNGSAETLIEAPEDSATKPSAGTPTQGSTAGDLAPGSPGTVSRQSSEDGTDQGSMAAPSGTSSGVSAADDAAAEALPVPEPPPEPSGPPLAGNDDEVGMPPAPVTRSRFGEAGGSSSASRPPGLSRQRAIRAALASLPVPPAGPSFWADLEAAIDDQQPFSITTRPAIRPISEPPPLSQPRLTDRMPTKPAELGVGGSPTPPGLPGSLPGSGGSGRRNLLVVVAVTILAALVVLANVAGEDDEAAAPPRSDPSTTAPAEETTTSTTAPTTTTAPQVPGLAPTDPLTPAGLGPLQIGLRGRDLQEEGVQVQFDTATFDGSGGRCFDAAVAGAPDLLLRFRSGDPAQGVDEPLDGILAAITVSGEQGASMRATDVGLTLGATGDQVQQAYEGAAQISAHPAGQVHVAEASDGSNNGIAYVTDGSGVVEINVGNIDVIPQPDVCT